MQEKNGLLEKWANVREKRTKQAVDCLAFNYADEKQKHMIAEALAFWRLVVESDLALYEIEWPEAFLSDVNHFIRLIAMIVLVPKVLWRRILWRYNIDFQSRESFLRRLKPEQAEAIEANYADLVANRIPRAFSRWEVFTLGITAIKLKNDQIEHPVNRYQTKSAWSFNLKPFDFGFNAYPNGDRDDKAEFFVSTKKFLSAKKHENDFVVDKEFGGYWWLYRKARSNFAYRPNRKVELKPQVCPGFWWTIVMHLWFWVVSPLLAVSLYTTAPAVKHFWYLPWPYLVGMPIALLTPLWLTLATLRLLIEGVLWFFIDWLGETVTNYLKLGIMVLIALFICLVLIGAAAGLYLKILPYLGKLCSLTFILLILSSIVLVVYAMNRKEERKKFHREVLHAWYAQLILTTLAFLVVHGRSIIGAIYHFFVWIGHLIVSTISFLIASMMIVGLYWLLLILPAAILAATWALLRLPPEKQEKAFVVVDRLSPFFFAVYIAALLGIAFYKIGVVVGFVFLIVSVISWFGATWTMREQNPVRHKAKKINRTILYINCNLKLPYGVYLRNTKLQAMPEGKQRQLLENATYLIGSIFGHGDKNSGYFYSLVAKLDQETLARFEAIKRKIGALDSIRVKENIFWLMLDDPKLDYDEALRMVQLDKHESSERRERMLASLKWLATPLILAGKALYRGIMAFVDLCRKLGFLYTEFNKRCPFIEQPRNLWY